MTTAGLWWGSRIYISNKFPSDAAGLVTTLWEPLLISNQVTFDLLTPKLV